MHIRREAGLEALAPQITYYKKTRRGKVRFTEALFPGYLFVHCNLVENLRHLLSLQGIRNLVKCGSRIPEVPISWIEEISAELDGETITAQQPELKAGDEVTIVEGPFKNLKAVVKGEVPAQERVSLLLEFLGRQIEVNLSQDKLFMEKKTPKAFIR